MIVVKVIHEHQRRKKGALHPILLIQRFVPFPTDNSVHPINSKEHEKHDHQSKKTKDQPKRPIHAFLDLLSDGRGRSRGCNLWLGNYGSDVDGWGAGWRVGVCELSDSFGVHGGEVLPCFVRVDDLWDLK